MACTGTPMARARWRPCATRSTPAARSSTRNLGGLTTSAIGFGAMALVDGMYGHADGARSLETLRHAIDAGGTFIDTEPGRVDDVGDRLRRDGARRWHVRARRWRALAGDPAPRDRRRRDVRRHGTWAG